MHGEEVGKAEVAVGLVEGLEGAVRAVEQGDTVVDGGLAAVRLHGSDEGGEAVGADEAGVRGGVALEEEGEHTEGGDDVAGGHGRADLRGDRVGEDEEAGLETVGVQRLEAHGLVVGVVRRDDAVRLRVTASIPAVEMHSFRNHIPDNCISSTPACSFITSTTVTAYPSCGVSSPVGSASNNLARAVASASQPSCASSTHSCAPPTSVRSGHPCT